MYTFLFASGIKGMPPETLLRSAGGIVKQLMPSQGVDIVESVTLLPELRGGWVRLAPTLEPPPHILSELVSDDHAALVFGEVQHMDQALLGQFPGPNFLFAEFLGNPAGDYQGLLPKLKNLAHAVVAAHGNHHRRLLDEGDGVAHAAVNFHRMLARMLGRILGRPR